jgi:hypothetical protein
LKEIQTEGNYIPGQCNIGPDETRKRLRIGYLGLALMIIFVLLAEYYAFPPIWKLALFAPTVYAFSGFIQARQKFCFLFGFIGVFSTAGRKSRVGDELKIKKDRSKALVIIAQVFLISLLVTFLYYFLTAG